MVSELRARVVALFTVLALLAPSAPVWAEPTAAAKETARSLMDDGDRKVAAGDLRGALQSYRGADDIMHVPTTSLEVARTQIKLALLVEARDTLQALLRQPAAASEPAAFARARTEAARLNDELQKRIPSVRVQVSGLAAGAVPEVTVDGESMPSTALGLPRKVNPGTRRIVASARGYQSVTAEVKVSEGQTLDVPLALTPLPAGTVVEPPPTASVAPPPASTVAPPPATTVAPLPTAPTSTADGRGLRKPVLVYGGFGLGALGLVTGVVGGAVAMSRVSKAREHCQGDLCTEEARGDIVATKNWALVSNVGFAVALVGAGIGVVALISGRGAASSARGPTIEPLIGPGALGARGTF